MLRDAQVQIPECQASQGGADRAGRNFKAETLFLLETSLHLAVMRIH